MSEHLDSRIDDIPNTTSVDPRPSLVPDGMSSPSRDILQPSQENKDDRHCGTCGGSRHFAEVDGDPTNRTEHGEWPFDSAGQHAAPGHTHGQTCCKWLDTPAGTITAVPRSMTLCSGEC